MKRIPPCRLALPVLVGILAGFAVSVSPSRADVARILPLKSSVAVGEFVTLKLPGGVGEANCNFRLDLGVSSDSGFRAGSIEVSGSYSNYNNIKLQDGTSVSESYDWGTTVVPKVRFLAPGTYQLNVIDGGRDCAGRVAPQTVTVRNDYAPMSINIYARPGKSAVKRIDGQWALAPGKREIWITREAEADLSAMTDGYVPGAWKQIFPSAFTATWAKAGVEIARIDRRVGLSGIEDSEADEALILVLGREEPGLLEDVAAGRLVKLGGFSSEVMIEPLRKGSLEVAAATRAEQARSADARTRLGDPGTIVGFRIARSPKNERPAR